MDQSSADINLNKQKSVFLNCPYDQEFRDLFLAYIVGISSFGLTPRTTLEVPGGEQRLRRIVKLIQSCSLSFHDLSRVELQTDDPPTPRFNMAFEAGLAVMTSLHHNLPEHTYFIFEADFRRLKKSLSDLEGSDPYEHKGTPEGVLSQISNALIEFPSQPTTPEMMKIMDQVVDRLPKILKNAGSETLYTPRVFKAVVVVATEIVNRRIDRAKKSRVTGN